MGESLISGFLPSVVLISTYSRILFQDFVQVGGGHKGIVAEIPGDGLVTLRFSC